MNKILTLLMMLFGMQAATAGAPGPPPPTPPPPPGLPIDGYLILLFFTALVTGYFLSKRYNTIKKGSL